MNRLLSYLVISLGVLLFCQDVAAQQVVSVGEVESEQGRSQSQLLLKTNGVGWAMLVSNLAVEYDFSPRWTVALPVYYSAWDYFTETRKFRTLALRPEGRFWFSPKDAEGSRKGFFLEAHFGLAWYNFALSGSDTRYQDHGGHTPAIGGGIGGGYRVPFRKGSPWSLEFAVGAGVYRLHYDMFDNTGNISEDRKKGEKQNTALLIDNVAVSISYSFDLTGKGGGK